MVHESVQEHQPLSPYSTEPSCGMDSTFHLTPQTSECSRHQKLFLVFQPERFSAVTKERQAGTALRYSCETWRPVFAEHTQKTGKRLITSKPINKARVFASNPSCNHRAACQAIVFAGVIVYRSAPQCTTCCLATSQRQQNISRAILIDSHMTSHFWKRGKKIGCGGNYDGITVISYRYSPMHYVSGVINVTNGYSFINNEKKLPSQSPPAHQVMVKVWN